ncbi:MAG: DUF3160 domain-containing protein [Patescibacteria group bacterium]|nr:DUF3160 domain-containing protein [Patescibacteria group bacterium]
MNKTKLKKAGLVLLIIFVIVLAVISVFIYTKNYLAVPNNESEPLNNLVNNSQLVKANEPILDFVPTYQENKVPLSQVTNYQALSAKYGLNLSSEQETFLEANRFLLIDTDQVPFFSSSFNFDQWLLDSDSLGGGSIYERKPEDAVLVTPDTVLHAYHKYFELTLEQLEQHELSQALGSFLSGLHANLSVAVKDSQGEVRTRYQNLEAQIVLARILFENKNVDKPTYFASPADEQQYGESDKTADSLVNAKKLLQTYSADLSPELIAAIDSDLGDIYAAENIGASPLFKQYDDQIQTDYTQFTPRSHYSKNSVLRAYFRTMMYLGRSSYLLHSDLAIADTNLLLKQMELKNSLSEAPIVAWHKITDVTSFYAGESDDISYQEWKDFTTSVLGTQINKDEELIARANIDKLKANLDKLKKPRILSDVIIDENMAGRDKASLLNQSLSFRVFGQKFSYDAWILNDLTAGQEKTEVRLPSTPSALFIPAAFGDNQAREYSGDFLKKSADFSQAEVSDFFTKLDQKKLDIQKVSGKEWFNSMASSWLYILGSLTYDYGNNYPLYMQSPLFSSKQIQSFLGSYAELKHDTLLYAKQSYAELGAGGNNEPLPPVVKGFVEPNLVFWQRFNLLLNRTEQLFNDNNLFTNQSAAERLSEFKKISLFYADIAEKELRSQAISDDDYERLRTVKLTFMAQPFEALDPSESSYQTALIADVHTDMLKNQILYEATAKPYLMLAIVANENLPRVVAGLVYNHYELTDPIGKRLSDESWRQQVYQTSETLPTKNFWYQSLLIQ